MRRFFRWPVLLSVAALATGGTVLAKHLWATPGFVIPRDDFTTMYSFTPAELCDPTTPNFASIGVDGQGPFLNFSALAGGAMQVFTYRPRGLIANTPAQFGDGGIHAVDLFRSLFDRWARTGAVGAAVFVPGPAAQDHWTKMCHFGPPLPKLPMNVEIGSIMQGYAGGMPTLQIAADVTGTFEDYQFTWDPQ